MSLLSKINLQIHDLEAVRRTAEEFRGELVLNCTKFHAYVERQCTHKIKVPGTTYEVGLVQEKDGSYSLLTDFHDGSIARVFGQQMAKFKQTYTVHAAMNAARKQGYMCQRKTLANGTQQVVMSV